MLDVRSKPTTTCSIDRAFTALDELPALVPELLHEPAAVTVTIVMSNDEAAATEARKRLQAESIANVYILVAVNQ
jgi:hypothetical protein